MRRGVTVKFVVLDWLCICVFPLHTNKSIDSITFTHAVLLYITWYRTVVGP